MTLTLLSPFEGEPELSEYEDELPRVLPRFFIPRLEDRPQDPIMDALRVEREFRLESSLPKKSSPKLTNMVEVKVQEPTQDSLEGNSNPLWKRALMEGIQVQSQIRSWDSLRPSFSSIASPGPFLSEQSDSTFAAARYYVNPQLEDPACHVLHISMKELFTSIKHVLVGNSSSLYQWDSTLEAFVLPSTADGKRSFIVVDGKDDALMQRQPTTPTRLICEWSSSSLQNRRPIGPQFCARADNVYRERSFAAVDVPGLYSNAGTTQHVGLVLGYEEFEDVLKAIACLCGRSLDLSPSAYPTLSSQPEVLLSSIYARLQYHFEKGSVPLVRAMLAHVFTSNLNSGFDFGEEDDQEDLRSVSSTSAEEFPGFISSDAAEVLIRARRSLKFLSTAQPDHPVLQHSPSCKMISWFWTNEEVETAWDSKSDLIDLSDTRGKSNPAASSDISSEGGLLEQFKVFALEPGTHFARSAQRAGFAFQSFIANFPPCLPPLTPTLTHLSNLVLSPLLRHCVTVSGALISLLLSPGSHLHLHSHLVLLRSYLLLTLPAFTRRLQAALFSDSDDWNFESSTVRAMAKSMHSRKHTVPRGSDTQWAVGLGLGLAERDSWPPGGSDLSYYLRTVIVDSLESLTKSTDTEALGSSEGRSRIFEEAEFRLGFAIRDLPIGSGRERWLNPSSIEALDFLLMDYKPPPPLDVVITPDVLSKYQRIFSFILVFCEPSDAVPFLGQSLISALASHVPDVAVRGNVDPFLARLTPDMFTDVFELAGAHSDMMDDVLSACERRRGRVEEYVAMPVLENLYASFVDKMNTLVKALREEVERGSMSPHISMEYLHLTAGGSKQPMATGGAGSLHHLLLRLDIGPERTSFLPGRRQP
ncbi:hypothetical protein B0F90DRAFT_1815131 [Multifurca ochricompacta]|uniref:Spindle pole body component n=1 Tax=Multifurca ochricompacta TaxID=376703 RepID=A0AAD4QN66_9AGAM|nr:hypothetical protein B0F90DRAFT_1815131 [Multifurca ochricompacta]